MKTYIAKKEEVKRSWYVVDATDRVLGRLATRIATVLMGKHRPTFTSHVDTGDFVIVTNAERVRLTGRKEEQKVYRHHTGWQGHLREESVSSLRTRHPDQIIRLAVRRMLPKTTLGSQMIRKLKVYVGPDHPHVAQMPAPLPQVVETVGAGAGTDAAVVGPTVGN